MVGKESGHAFWHVAGNIAACVMLLSVTEARAGDGVAAQGPPTLPAVPVVYPSIREFQWTYHVVVMNVVEREYAIRAPEAATRPVRWNYDGPVTRTERRKIGSYPELSCKYFDFTVSNECRTIWHDVYADLPYIIVRPQHVDFDVPVVRIVPQLFPVTYPQWTLKEVTLTLTLPVISTVPMQGPRWSRNADNDTRLASSLPSPAADSPREPTTSSQADADTPAEIAQALAALAQQRTAMIRAMDEGQRSLDTAIASAQSAGVDPAALVASDGTRTDLYALRATLLEQRSRELSRMDQIAVELRAALL